MKVTGFEWDDNNQGHIRRHGLDSDDVEYLFVLDAPVFFVHPKAKGRFVALGLVHGKFVACVFEKDQSHRVRVITAYPTSNQKLWRRYESTRKKKSG